MIKRKKEEGAQFVKFFGPLLDALRKLGGSGSPDEVVEQIATDLALSDEIQNDLLPSGEPRFRNQVHWARFYLVRESLLDSSKRGVWSLTERGRASSLTYEQAHQIFLRWVKIFQEQRRAKTETAEPIAEQVAEGTGSPSKDYRAETIELLLSLPPAGFERLSQRLLVMHAILRKLGGGDRRSIGRSNEVVLHKFVSGRLVEKPSRLTPRSTRARAKATRAG